MASTTSALAALNLHSHRVAGKGAPPAVATAAVKLAELSSEHDEHIESEEKETEASAGAAVRESGAASSNRMYFF